LKEHLTLVDELDKPYGTLDKQLVHQKGLLHRAFSVFIFNSDGEMLLQQRANEKYHSGGLWTNACCSHPWVNEPVADAARRRTYEELRITCEPRFVFSLIYKATFENGLTEHELDHVFTAVCDQVPDPLPSEVQSWKYMNTEMISKDLRINPENYTVWFRIIFEKLYHEN